MRKLSRASQEAIVEKALARDGRTLTAIARAHNISRSTLFKWTKKYLECSIIKQHKPGKINQALSALERFEHLIATATLDEAGVGAYCREKGIYSFQLTEWKEIFMNQKSSEKQQSNFIELKALRTENKQLKQEVRRKDSALAEATALLILKKKAALIWGEPVED
jgi:transposase